MRLLVLGGCDVQPEAYRSRERSLLLSVSCGDNAGLHCVVCLVSREATGHGTLVESSNRTVAVVPADSEDDCPLPTKKEVIS